MTVEREEKHTELGKKKADMKQGDVPNITPAAYNLIQRGPDRRRSDERRNDPREGTAKVSILTWIRSIFKPRVGLDRRKGNDRRTRLAMSKEPRKSVELTPEELKQLLD